MATSQPLAWPSPGLPLAHRTTYRHEDENVSLFDRLSDQIQEDAAPASSEAPRASLFESTAELLNESEGEVLSEMLGGMHVSRYMNPRDLQYALEDAATTCERSWADRKRWNEGAGLEKPHNNLVTCLRDCSKKAKAYADAIEAAQKKRNVGY